MVNSLEPVKKYILTHWLVKWQGKQTLLQHQVKPTVVYYPQKQPMTIQLIVDDKVTFVVFLDVNSRWKCIVSYSDHFSTNNILDILYKIIHQFLVKDCAHILVNRIETKPAQEKSG